MPYAIQTVLEQSFDSYELIISDNSDASNVYTEKLVKEYPKEKKIKYYRPPMVLSMSDHWEFALSKTSGEFIIIFGDDDGLVYGALEKIYFVLKSTNTKLVSWARVEYNWPDRLPFEVANQMTIPYQARTGMMHGESYIRKVVRFKADYRYLPMFYNSAVHRSILDILVTRTGRIFNATSPDIYTGFAFAHLMKNYITIGYPLSINGVSSKSNGAAHSRNDISLKTDFLNLNSSSSIKWPDTIPSFYTGYSGIIEPYIQLAKHFPELANYITRKSIYRIIIHNLELTSKEDLDLKISGILESARNDNALYIWAKKYLAKEDLEFKELPIQKLEKRVGFLGSHLVLDASKFGLHNVYDVSVFTANLFGEMKSSNFSEDALPDLKKRIRKAGAILLRGV